MSNIALQDTVTSSRIRLGRIDIARGIALIAMAIYHFGWDLEFLAIWRLPRPLTADGNFSPAVLHRAFCFWSVSALFWRMATEFAGSL